MRRLAASLVCGTWMLLPGAHALNVPPANAAADLVLGQPNFSTSIPGETAANTLLEPAAVVVDPATRKVFVADTGNNRVLRYPDARALASGVAAEAVLGQPNVAEGSLAPTTASTMNSPIGLWIDPGGRLWVSDTENHRVLMFPNAATAPNGTAASLILGQSTATGNLPAASSNPGANPPPGNRLHNPLGLCVDAAGRLWVADSGNNRVLRFDNAAGKSTGAPANGVLGQPNFTSTSPGSGNQNLHGPRAVAADAKGTLWIADTENQRVFGYPSAATVSNGTNAALVIGQADFNQNSPGVGAARLNAPSGLFADADNNLWVLDQGNHRALRFADITSFQNGGAASAVVGQPDFNGSLPGTSARNLDGPFVGLFVDGTRAAWVSDLNNNRVLRFSAVDDEPPTISIMGRTRLTTKRPQILLRGRAADDVRVLEVVLKNGGARPVRASGTVSWRKGMVLTPGRNRVIAFARDTAGKSSARRTIIVTRR